MQRIMIGLALLGASAAWAQAPAPPTRTVTYEAVTAENPVAFSRLRLTEVEPNGYAVDLAIVAPNPSHHTGHIRGFATGDGRRLVLKVPNFMEDGELDRPALCTMAIEADETRARVVSEDNCASFHGAGASWLDQARNLIRKP